MDFQYDANGNATYDPNKNVNISYNHLNLPHRFDFGSGKIIDIVYNTLGIKLRKIVKQNNVVLYQQDYINGIEYKDNNIESFPISEGRMYNENVNSGGALDLRYEFAIKDHLGNTRVMFTDKDNDGRIEFGTNGANNEILSESHYYPFGMAMYGPWMDNYGTDNENKYLYNGKELNTDFGLDLIDYGARWYDPAIGRWHSVDPLADWAPDLTPYRYGFNNPISFIDPDGRFESRKEAREYRRAQGIDGKIKVNGSGDSRVIYIQEEGGGQHAYGGVSAVDGGSDVVTAGGVDMGINELFAAAVTNPDLKRYVYNNSPNEEFTQRFFNYSQDYQSRQAAAPLALVLGAPVAIIAGAELAGAYSVASATSAVTNTAVTASRQYTKHALKQMADRKVTKKMVDLVLRKGQKFFDPKNGSINYVLKNAGKDVMVATNQISGKVVTVVRSSKNLVNSRYLPF